MDSASLPQALSVPIPVMTTRRRTLRLLLDVVLDVLDRVADRLDLLRVLVGDVQVELVLELHHQLDRVEAVGAEVVDEAGLLVDLLLRSPHLLADDLDHAVSNAAGRVAHVASCRVPGLDVGRSVCARGGGPRNGEST